MSLKNLRSEGAIIQRSTIKRRFKIALFLGDGPCIVKSEEQALECEKHRDFVGWVTEWVYYE